MKNLPYEKTSIFLHVIDYLDRDEEPVDFEIVNGEGLTIKRETTEACMTNPDKHPEIEGFDFYFSMESAIRLRDFLNYALPNEGDV